MNMELQKRIESDQNIPVSEYFFWKEFKHMSIYTTQNAQCFTVILCLI